ncbi:hypothetical protein KXW76_003663, partial [Aspergillus fumigatus]
MRACYSCGLGRQGKTVPEVLSIHQLMAKLSGGKTTGTRTQGRSVLHCARRGSNRDTFDLVGIDFRASNPTVIYETSVVGRRHWAHNKFCRRLVLIGEQHELVVLSDNEQWVGTGTISILSGENGQLLFQFDGGPAHFLGHKTVAYPTINQFSIQTVPARIRLNDAVQPWEAHAK